MIRKRRTPGLNAAGYEVVAGAVRTIADPVARIAVANHFAKFFHARSGTFDAQRWYEATGGKVNP